MTRTVLRFVSLLAASSVVCLPSVAQSVGTEAEPHYLNACTPVDTTTAVSDWVRQSPLYGKTMVIVGDSYVRNHRGRIEDTWHWRVAQKYHMSYYNYGRNGNCVAFDRKNWGISMLHRFSEMKKDADYVVIVAGHNDASLIAAAEDVDTATWNPDRKKAYSDSMLQLFEENVTAFVDSLIARYPSARICWFTPWNVPRPGFREMHSVLTRVLESRAIPYFDAAHRSGIYVWDPAFRRRYFQGPNDTAHLNPRGHQLFQNKAESFLLSL